MESNPASISAPESFTLSSITSKDDTGVIGEIVPELRDKIPGLEPPPILENPEQSRFRLFDAISTFLKTAASFRPIVLVLDDLHWADRPSLLLLQFLSRLISDSCLLVVGCYRDMELDRQHPLAEALGERV